MDSKNKYQPEVQLKQSEVLKLCKKKNHPNLYTF